MEKSTLMRNALALHHSCHVHRKEPKSWSKLKAMVSGVLEDQQQHSLATRKEKRWEEDRAIAVEPVKSKGDGKRGDWKQWSSNGSCSEGATCAFKHGDQCEEREKETSGSGRQLRQNDSPLRNQKSVAGQAQARQEKKADLPVSATRKVDVCKTRLVFCVFHEKENNADHLRIVPSSASAKLTDRRAPKSQPKRGLEHDRARSSRRRLSEGSQRGEHPSVPKGNWTPTVNPLVSLRRQGRLHSRGSFQRQHHTKWSIPT